MNMPDLNEARKRTKDKVNILYDEYIDLYKKL